MRGTRNLFHQLLQQRDGVRLRSWRPLVDDRDALRPDQRRSSFRIFSVESRAFGDEELNDFVRSAVRSAVQGGESCVIRCLQWIAEFQAQPCPQPRQLGVVRPADIA